MDDRELLIDDLERSGIPARYIKKLGFRVVRRDDAAEILQPKAVLSSTLVAYEIPFFNHLGKRINFSRLRRLKGNWFKPFKDAKPDAKKFDNTFRYNQRANTSPHVYFPPIYKFKLNDAGKICVPRIVITEGEKKAVKACLMGIPTIALAGVYNFKSRRKRIDLIDDFHMFELSNTDVEICYDSDMMTNPLVREAIDALIAQLNTLRPRAIRIVFLDGESAGSKSAKLGLDDFLLQFKSPEEAQHAFDSLARKAEAGTDALTKLDKDLTYSAEQASFYSGTHKRFFTRQQLQDLYGNMTEVPDPTDPRKSVSPINLWMRTRTEHTNATRLTYAPAKPAVFRQRSTDPFPSINSWRPSHVVPVRGKPTPWLELFDFLTQRLSPENKTWLMQWLAYPIQHPGTKLFTAVFAYSNAQGIGKNFLVSPLLSGIYGDNFKQVDGKLLLSDFNSWAANKQFVFLDEVYMPGRFERKSIMGTLNSLITNSELEVNEKFQPRYSLGNFANMYFTSNHADAIPIAATDRRFFVLHAPEKPMPRGFYKTLDAWCKEPDSAGRLLRYLMEDVDVSAFNPRAAAPHTNERADVVRVTSDTFTYLIEELISNTTSVVHINGKLPEKELFTSAELAKMLNTYARSIDMGSPCTPQMVQHALRTRLAEAYYRKQAMRFGKTVERNTLFAILNREKWAKRDRAEWHAHYRKHDQRFQHPTLEEHDTVDDNVVSLDDARRKREIAQ